MKLLQSWKVKLYAFVTVFLFVTGAAVALWPQDSGINIQATSNNPSTIKVMRNEILDEKKSKVSVQDNSTASIQSESGSTLIDEMDGEPEVLPPTASSQAKEQQSPQTEQPEDTPDPQLRLIDLPISEKPLVLPPKKCGGCRVVIDDDLRCPQKSNDLDAHPCKLEY